MLRSIAPKLAVLLTLARTIAPSVVGRIVQGGRVECAPEIESTEARRYGTVTPSGLRIADGLIPCSGGCELGAIVYGRRDQLAYDLTPVSGRDSFGVRIVEDNGAPCLLSKDVPNFAEPPLRAGNIE
jgi:hypothetical protein